MRDNADPPEVFETGTLGNFSSATSSVRIVDITASHCLALVNFFRFSHGYLFSNSKFTIKFSDLFGSGYLSDQVLYSFFNFIANIAHEFYGFCSRIRQGPVHMPRARHNRALFGTAHGDDYFRRIV